jgi:hypothetical protein
MADHKQVVPVPWAGPGPASERAELPKWLSSPPIPSSVNPFDTAAPESIEQPIHFAQPSHPPSAPPPLDDAMHAAMVAAAMQPQPTPAPERNWDAEIEGLLQEIADLQHKLASVGGSAERMRRQLFEGCERDAVQLAVAIAERVVDRELRTDPGLIARWARQALETIADQHDLQVIVSQDVFDAVPNDMWREAGGHAIVPRVDPDLPPGSCEVRGELSRIDASAAARVRAVVEALGITEGR